VKLLQGIGKKSSAPRFSVEESIDILTECFLLRCTIEELEAIATESLEYHTNKPRLEVINGSKTDKKTS
jgi:hypothetical protein